MYKWSILKAKMYHLFYTGFFFRPENSLLRSKAKMKKFEFSFKITLNKFRLRKRKSNISSRTDFLPRTRHSVNAY